MSKTGYRSVSVDSDTVKMLQELSANLESRIGIKLTLAGTIKYLVNTRKAIEHETVA